MNKTKRRILSILLTLALVLGLMPGMSLTAYAETYDSHVDNLQAGDILEPGASFDAMDNTVIFQAGGWCTRQGYEEPATYTQGTEDKTFNNLQNVRVFSEDGYLGAIEDEEDYTKYYPYANGAKADVWKVVSVEGGDEPWDSQTITLTGYVETQSNNPFTSSVYYRQYDSTGTQMDNGTLAANTGIKIESDTKKWVDGKTYIADGTVTIDSRVKVTGTVNLILLDGASLTINGGIAVKPGNTLNIYAGNTTRSISGSGVLTAAAGRWNAGIGSGGSDWGETSTVNIHGGSITATGGDNGAGIGGECCRVVNIYDGSVTANGGDESAGIGGGYNEPGGTVTIYGGTVTATGGESGAGIGGGMYESGGTVSIYGGTVTASGGNKLSWGNYSDSMGIGKGSTDDSSITDGTLTLGTGVSMSVSADNSTWSAYDGSTRAQYMKTGSASVAVTGVTLAPSDAQTVTVGESVAFTATVAPDGATDKTVKWSVGGTDASAVKLYTDADCTTEVGSDATETLTVYAKGISAGSATVTATSNADSTKSASCDVTVNEAVSEPENIIISPASGDIAEALVAAEEGKTVGNITINLTEGVTYTISNTIVVPASLTINGNGAIIDAGNLNAPMIALANIENPTQWTELNIAVSGLYVNGLKKQMFYSACKNYLCKTFTVDNCVVEVVADVITFDFTKGSVAESFVISNSTFYAPTATTKSLYSSQSGQKLTEYNGDTTQSFKLTHNTFFNLAPTKNFFVHRQNNQKWLSYEAKGNVFANCGKRGQVIIGLNGSGISANPTWDIDGNLFNYDGADTSATETTGDNNEPVKNSVAGVVTFVAPASGNFNGTLELSGGATLPEKLGDPRFTLSSHTHSFTYSASGATITATCTADGCDLPESSAGAGDHVATLTISASGGTYDGTTAYGATITDANSIQGDAKVQYQKKTGESYGTATETAPTDAGTYRASITLGEDEGAATASVEYTIAQATPNITNNPTASEITFGQTLANSTLSDGTVNVAGAFAWKDTTIAPTVSDSQTTEYDVVFTPTDGNYTTAECKVKLTVNKATAPAVTVPTLEAVTYDPTKTLADVTLPDDWAWVTDTTVPTVGNEGYAATYIVPDDTNYDYTNVEGYNSETHKVTRTVALTVNKAASTAATVTAATRTYDGTEAALATVTDEAVGGTMSYAIGNDGTTAPEGGWVDTIPVATDTGTYYVWYKVTGDANHNDTTPACVEVKINPVDKTDLNNAITEAETYYNSIKDETIYADVASALKTAIDAAKAIADNDNVVESVVTEAITVINVAKTTAEAGKKDVDDTIAADAVTKMINELPAEDKVTVSDAEQIAEAREAYEALTNDQKKKVTEDTLGMLEAREEALTDSFVSDVTGISEITEENKKEVEDLLASYDKLTDSEKAAVDQKIGRKITNLEKALDVTDRINKLGSDLDVADEKAVIIARTAYELLTDAQKAMVSEDTLKKLEAAEEQIEALKEADVLKDAKATAVEKLQDYAAAKALSDASKDEQKAYEDAIADEIVKINAAETKDTVASALTAGKKAVDDKLEEIRQARAEAAEMAAADEAISDAKTAAEAAVTAADAALGDTYVPADDKTAINTAKSTLATAVNAANGLNADATAEEKNTAAKNVMDAVKALTEATDKANVDSAVAKLEEATAAEQLKAAKEAATGRLEDYAQAKAMADATESEKNAYNAVVTAGLEAIDKATTPEKAAEELNGAKKAVDEVIENLKKARADKQAMDEADDAVQKAKEAADSARSEAAKAKGNVYISEDDKKAIDDADEKLMAALNKTTQFPEDVTAIQKNLVAKEIQDAAEKLLEVVNAANENSAATKVEADKLAAAKEIAIGRLTDYAQAKALADATADELKEIDKAVADGQKAINEAKDSEEVAEVLEIAKAAVDVVFEEIAEARAEEAAMEEATAAIWNAVDVAGTARNVAATSKSNPYISDDDLKAIKDAETELLDAIDAIGKLPVDATAEQKMLVAKAILDAADKLTAAAMLADINSAAAEEVADALAAAKETATDRLNDYAEAKALANMSEEEKNTYNGVIADGLKAIADAQDVETVKAAVVSAKHVIDTAIEEFKDARAAEEIAKETMEAADQKLADSLVSAAAVEVVAEEVAANEYASADDKKAIETAIQALNDAIVAASEIPENATADQKNDAAKAIEDATKALAEAADKAVLNEAVAKALADAEQVIAEELAAAKTHANERLSDYSRAKTMSDATKAEKKAISKPVTDGTAAINAAKDKAAVATALSKAMTAVDKAVAKIEKDRRNAAAVKVVTDMANKLPAKAKVKVSDKEAINEALAAYKALTKAQKKLVTEKTKNRLRNARAGLTIAVNKAAAKKVTNKIKKLPAAKNVKKSNRNAIVAARTAYKALTKAQKKYVTEKTKNKLRAAINALKKLK